MIDGRRATLPRLWPRGPSLAAGTLPAAWRSQFKQYDCRPLAVANVR